jgi:hypothetical protein
MLKEYLRSGFSCDTLLTWCRNGHIIESINNHIDTIITMHGGGKNLHVIHVD